MFILKEPKTLLISCALTMSKTIRSDDDLWRLIREDQESAFTQLMERLFASLIHYGRKFSSDKDLVQDCVQDVLVDLWLRRTQTQPILSIRTYLFSSVRHSVCRRARQNQRFGSLTSDVEDMPFTITFSVEETWIADEIDRERLHQLNLLMNQLPPRQKEIIYLRYYQGLEKDQIASILDINYQSVSNLLHRALTNLRGQFPTSLPVLFWLYFSLLEN
ncbi:sigma-70 family RNA polymerase sigma factor [Spirosoma endbachense]|uniref:Sigma-70 family RNA polymerase sigma factor n=2 Tax=Spirosoma endbachense TaxID=2666025 RepID=A0A6P1VV54_9BACT|nr:sigma-70 family RNA polymerase sigma factor [Spirosoma endbachense]